MSLSLIVRAPSLRGSLFAAVSALALSGCVSAVNEQFDTAAVSKPNVVVADANDRDDADDNADASNQADAQAPSGDIAQNVQSAAAEGEAGNQMAGLVTQPTGIAATQNSIFANGAQQAQIEGAGEGSMQAPAFVPVPSANPAVKSLYQQDLASQAAALDAQNNKLHAVAQTQNAYTQVAAVQPQVQADPVATEKPQAVAQPSQSQTNTNAAPRGNGTVTLAAFFAAAAKKGSSGGFDSSAGTVETLSGSAPNPMGIALVGRSTMDEAFDDEHEEDTPPPAGLMKLASLSSLSRVAPNGLRLQTEKVSVACMKPELIRRIQAIETHYKRAVVVTSGYRPRVNNVRRGSLHHSCDAADIQVAGVSKWELAKYLRAQPDRGGVGTYCHTESVHLDTGEARDWNWRCRAPKKK